MATRYLEFKSDANSGAERLGDSTPSFRRSIDNRILAGPCGTLNLDEIKPVAWGELLDRVKTYPGARQGKEAAVRHEGSAKRRQDD